MRNLCSWEEDKPTRIFRNTVAWSAAKVGEMHYATRMFRICIESFKSIEQAAIAAWCEA